MHHGKADLGWPNTLLAHASFESHQDGSTIFLARTSRMPMKDTMRKWCRREMCGVVSM
jgi:hypothetical protein